MIQSLTILLAAAAYAAGALVFISSDRFRLPLAAFCAVFAGAMILPFFDGKIRWSARLVPAIILMGIAAAVAFPSWVDARSTATYVQDRLLLAGAAIVAGEDMLALSLTQEAEKEAPGRPDIVRLQATAVYNLHLSGRQIASASDWELQLQRIIHLPAPEPRLRFLAAIALCQIGRRAEGIGLLGMIASSSPATLAGREATAVLVLARDQGIEDLTKTMMSSDFGNCTRLERAAQAVLSKGPAADMLSEDQLARLLGPALGVQ